MPSTPPPSIAARVAITLNAVLAAFDDGRPQVLCVQSGDGGIALPYGPFDPERHRTFEIGMREWVTRQTSLSLGYIEQLYTFGDKGREAPAAALSEAANDERIVSVGYLALAPEPAPVSASGAGWRNWYSFFPWEDWRADEPAVLREHILPSLSEWVDRTRDPQTSDRRRTRISTAFGLDDGEWDEARTLERYELMYEAGLVVEAWRDRRAAALDLPKTKEPSGFETGAPMLSDHRRILATAVGRLRGKLRYRPVIFEMTQREFTLLELQKMIEAIVGFEFHKQNFRRSVEKSGFVERTGETTQQAGGRPAALFRVNRDGLRERAAAGLALPRLRRD
ncbi:MAG: NAD regulator [Pseudomonadota bacterium]